MTTNNIVSGIRDLFCREYIKDLSGGKAARRAGYADSSADSMASRLLADDAVQARIAELAAERNKELKLDARDVLLELMNIAFFDPLPLVDEAGLTKPLADMPAEARRMIASFDVVTTTDINDGTMTTTTKVKLWNKGDALEKLGRHLALFKDVLLVQHEGGNIDEKTSIEIAARVASYLEAARMRKLREGAIDAEIVAPKLLSADDAEKLL